MNIQYFPVSLLFPPLGPLFFSTLLYTPIFAAPTNSSIKPQTRHVDNKFHEIRDFTHFAHYYIPSTQQIIGVQLCLPNKSLKIKHFSNPFTH